MKVLLMCRRKPPRSGGITRASLSFVLALFALINTISQAHKLNVFTAAANVLFGKFCLKAASHFILRCKMRCRRSLGCFPMHLLHRKTFGHKKLRWKSGIRDDPLTHLAWIKHSILLRHCQSFPLQIYSYSRPGHEIEETSQPLRLLRVKEAHILLPTEYITLCSDEQDSHKKDGDEFHNAMSSPDSRIPAWGDGLEFSVFITHQYPDNHNPLLPIALQKRLDGMNPREFLTYVLAELTLEERESLMVDERQRRKTFLVNWPHGSQLSGINMAKCGFYCVDDFDRVQCVFCRGCLHRWEPDDVPMREHARSFNFCRFAKGLQCGNREFRSDMLNADDLKNAKFLESTELTNNTNGTISVDGNSLGISTKKADTARYAPDASRELTFSRWPTSNPISPRRLTEAGFYFTGFTDQVRCFYCSGMLKDWSSGDDPFEEHARWFPDCSFLIQKKGQGWINQVHERTPAHKKCPRATTSQRVHERQEKQQKSDEEAMIEVCASLGHSTLSIHAAISLKSGPITSIRDLIDTIYAVDEEGITRVGHETDYEPAGAAASVDIPDEDRSRATMEVDSVATLSASVYPGVQGACIMCFRKSGKFMNADHIGLPCGHMIWCENCSLEEINKAASTQIKPKCPAVDCGAPLTATFKTFFA